MDYASKGHNLYEMPLHGDMQGIYAEYILSRMTDDDIEEMVKNANIHFFQSYNRKDLYHHLNEKQRQALLDRFNEYRDNKVKEYEKTPEAQAKIELLDEKIGLIRDDMAITEQDLTEGIAQELHEKEIKLLISSLKRSIESKLQQFNENDNSSDTAE